MTAIAKRPLDLLKANLEKPAAVNWLQKQLASTLNRNAQQMVNVVLQAASSSPKLAECTPGSILAALCVSAQIGLVPNTALGHAWLVPFGNRRKQGSTYITIQEATLIIGYQGMVKLVHDASGIALKAAPVYAGEPFEYNRAAAPPVTLHRHALEGKRGDLTYAYCLAYHPNGTTTGEVYDRTFVHERRQRSKSYGYRDRDGNFVVKKDSPWVTDPAPMWMKTAVRDFTKLVPKGNDRRLERAIEIDNLDDAHLGQGAVVDFLDAPLPAEVLDADEQVIEQATRQELGPGQDEEFQRWAAAIRETDSAKGHAEVMQQIGAARLGGEMQQRLMEVAKAHASTLKGGR